MDSKQMLILSQFYVSMDDNQATPSSSTDFKCGHTQCSIRHQVVMCECFACDKMAHHACYQHVCLNKNKVQHFSNDHPDAVVCCKKQ